MSAPDGQARAEPDDQRAPNANAEVARLFAEIGDILELKGEPPYRFNAYRSAARSVASAPERLDVLFESGRLRELRGVGNALEAKIVEYLATGRMEFHEQVRRDFPAALASLLQVPGLGPGRARTVYEALGIATVAELEQAARDGRLAHLSGFGGKTAESVLESISKLKQRSRGGLLSDAWVAAHQIRQALGASGSDEERLAVVGSTRRMQDSVGGLDLLAARDRDADAERLLDGLGHLPNLVEIVGREARRIEVSLIGGLRVSLTIVSKHAWGSGLIWYTGSKSHVERLQRRALEHGWALGPDGLRDQTGALLEAERETAIYERLGLPFIAPELREDSGEIEAADSGTLPKLVELSDLKGDLHCHTNWTDGTLPLDEMAKAAMARGYAYMALTDHTRNLTVARGLSPERLAEQRALVDRVNHALAPFVVLHGTEMDILLDGGLDFPDEVLRSLDYVSASVHTGFRQGREVMTERVVRAMSNPLVNTINHLHGRKIGLRDGYELDTPAVLQAAARMGCALELNASPARLDLNGAWARQARALGARFTISSDAHAESEFDYMQFGVGSARRGWLTADDVLNTRPLDQLRALLAQRRTR